LIRKILRELSLIKDEEISEIDLYSDEYFKRKQEILQYFLRRFYCSNLKALK